MRIGALKFIILVIICLYTSLSSASAVIENGRGGERWREVYREKVFSELFMRQAEMAIKGYSSTIAEIDEALAIARSGELRGALSKLLVMRGSGGGDSIRRREAIYLSGLINERLGFFPEALAHYMRVIRSPQKDTLYRRALMGRSFLLLREGVREEKNRLIERAGRLFYRVYRAAEQPEIWQKALAGYGLALSFTDNNDAAESVFSEINSFLDGNPPFRFFRAENFVKLGRADLAMEPLLALKGDKASPVMAGYALLRVGDMAVESGDRAEGEKRYQELVEKTGDRAGQVMGMMAMAELHRGGEEYGKAVEMWRKVVDGEAPYEVRDIALFYLLRVSEDAGSAEDVLNNAKKLLLTGVSTSWKKEGRKALSDTLFSFIKSAYSEGNYGEAVSLFYKHGPYIKEGRTRRIVADALLEVNLPAEARKIYLGLERGEKMGVPVKLIRTHIMEGEVESVEEDMRRHYKKRSAEMNVALREAGDLYMRRGAYDLAMAKYAMANNKLDFPELILNSAHLYTMTGKPERANRLLGKLIKRYPDNDIGARAYLGMGDANYAMERWSDALKAYTRAGAKIRTDDGARIHYRMGRLNLMLGRRKEAVTIWKGLAGEDGGYYGKLAGESVKEAALWKSIKM
ncbi:MAG: tetratricopeptide repeat protein [Thermodesulfobacteriota bacterium]